MTDKYVVIKRKDNGEEILGMLESDFFNLDIPNQEQNALEHFCLVTNTGEDEYTIEIIPYIKKSILSFQVGNVVRWDNMLFLVIHYDDSERTISLISFKRTNTVFSISDEHPQDPRKRISSIELISLTMEQFIVNKITELFFGTL